VRGLENDLYGLSRITRTPTAATLPSLCGGEGLLYKTRRDALVALDEPAYGPIRILPNGVRMRALVSRPSVDGDASREVGGVASVVGNVFISSTGQGRPPAYRGNEAVRAQMRIHRRIHAAVLAFG
jgi:hypothetical protein